jgi:hypothetical protein
MKVVAFLLLLCLGFGGLQVRAASDASEVPPEHQNYLPLTFDIRSEPLPRGDVKFTVAVSGNKGSKSQFAEFPKEYTTTLGTYTIRDYSKGTPGPHRMLRSEEGTTLREVPSERRGNVITCTFTVTKEELENPDLVFSFYVPAPNRMPSGSNFFARLRRFLKP